MFFAGKPKTSVLMNTSEENSLLLETPSSQESATIVRELEKRSDVPEEPEEERSPENSVSNHAEDSRSVIESTPAPNESSAPPRKDETHVLSGKPTETENRVEKAPDQFSVTNRLVSFGFAEGRSRPVDTIVIHSTYNALRGDPFSVSSVLDIYKSYGVSAHYLVARDGKVYRLVDEKNTSYHAGASRMPDGRKNVNDFSIGIEVLGKDDGSPTSAQYSALTKLIADIETRHAIRYRVGHSDIAPDRKTDPWGFDWDKIGGKRLR